MKNTPFPCSLVQLSIVGTESQVQVFYISSWVGGDHTDQRVHIFSINLCSLPPNGWKRKPRLDKSKLKNATSGLSLAPHGEMQTTQTIFLPVFDPFIDRVCVEKPRKNQNRQRSAFYEVVLTETLKSSTWRHFAAHRNNRVYADTIWTAIERF